MGQLLFTFFGGKCPAIRHLEIELIHDQLPNDVLECWATAMWSIQACVCAASRLKDMQARILPMLTRLAEQLYGRTGLQPGELGSAGMLEVFDRLNERFTGRLGLDPKQIANQHAETVRSVHGIRSSKARHYKPSDPCVPDTQRPEKRSTPCRRQHFRLRYPLHPSSRKPFSVLEYCIGRRSGIMSLGYS
jgi:hypothetical protein